jgi:N-acetylglucosamine-6-phosphate deacetylase
MKQGEPALVSDALLAERIFDGFGMHRHSAVIIEEGRVRGIVPQSEVPPGCSRHNLPPGALIAPGFIDVQVNGGGGILVNDHPTADGMRAIARAHRQFGTTSCLPTFITDIREKAQAAIAAARAAAGRDGVLGLHLEGPFINPARAGIHSREHIAVASLADLEWVSELAGCGASLITLAPECVPAGFIASLARASVIVAAGHTETALSTMNGAIADGLRAVTHLHNAMTPMLAREPGAVGAAFSDPRIFATLIVDGIHVDAAVVRASFAAMGAERIALITDAMPTVGGAREEFELNGRQIRLRDGRLTSDAGTLAGAHLDMATAVRLSVQLAAVSLEDALRSASLTPARLLGVAPERGTLIPGARADMVALDRELKVLTTWVSGVGMEHRAESRDRGGATGSPRA